MITSETSKRIVVLVVMAALLLIGGSTWVFAHGGDVNLIHACVNNSSGTLKIVGPNASCKNNETALDWGIVGPAGPAGPQGPVGPAGPQGEPGEAGISGYQVVQAISANDTTSTKVVFAGCPDGQRPLGGGAFIYDPIGQAFLRTSIYAVGGGGVEGWSANAGSAASFPEPWYLVATVHCANVQ